jgi:hypothetical protein
MRKASLDYLGDVFGNADVKIDSSVATKGENLHLVENIGGLTVKWWMNVFGTLFMRAVDLRDSVCIYFVTNFDHLCKIEQCGPLEKNSEAHHHFLFEKNLKFFVRQKKE